ncbi:SapC family protein [Sphingomonas fennica]|nr:SapC family protein [Sphingomonas fennica]
MADTHALPPLYVEPVALNSTLHASWRLKEGDAAFAARLPFIQLVLAELVQASRSFPILFDGEGGWPLALLGLEKHVNLFVQEGRWDADFHVPAYIRRYPFVFISTADESRYVLGIDRASDRLVTNDQEGAPLFENGAPSELTRQALRFCNTYHAEASATNAFCAALKDQDLLVDRQGSITLADGRALALQGFKVVDPARLEKLDDAVLVDWHRNGWMAAIYAHIASLDFQRLLRRASKHAIAANQSSPMPAETVSA